jgi:uncharacterized membrane protein
MPLHYLNPLVCALFFALANIILKRGMMDGAGALRCVFITNGTFFICLITLWWIYPTPVESTLLWAPVVAGVAAFLGSLFSTLALKIGDVSVATPLLGGKVLFVALLSTWILGNQLPLSWWIGALLAGAGIFFLGRGPGKKAAGGPLWLTIILSLLGVFFFALMDIMIAGWGKSFGFQRFVALQQVVTFGLSLTLVPFFKEPLRKVPSHSLWWIFAGSLIIVGQFFLLNWTIAMYRDPTAINIVYSSRGVWSVVLVWSVGQLLGNQERDRGSAVLAQRALGALLLVIAISLVVVV